MLTMIISKWGKSCYLLYFYDFTKIYNIYNANEYVFNIVCIELHKVYMKKHISSHGIYSYLLINTDSLLFYSDEIKNANSIISLAQRKNIWLWEVLQWNELVGVIVTPTPKSSKFIFNSPRLKAETY